MPEPDRDTIAEYLRRLGHPPAIVARKPHDKRAPPMQVIWPIDLTEPVDQICWLAEQYNAVYCNLNPLRPEYLYLRPRQGTSIRDVMIARRTRILVDVDGHDVSKDEAERQKELVKTHLGWTPLIEADSGRGFALIYEVDYPTDRESNDLVKRFLKGLNEQFSCVDVTCSNAGRLTRVIGTLNVRDGERVPTRILNDRLSYQNATEGAKEDCEAA